VDLNIKPEWKTEMNNATKLLYTGRTHTSSGGRDGFARSSDGRLDIKLSPPGSKNEGTNPEQLFAAGWSACFIGAVRLAAHARDIQVPAESYVNAEVDLCNGDGAYFLQARLNVHLPGVPAETAQFLLEQAHLTCPYSKATRGNIEVAIRLIP
jgi:Ohr subfamily peroxiredoxin